MSHDVLGMLAHCISASTPHVRGSIYMHVGRYRSRALSAVCIVDVYGVVQPCSVFQLCFSTT
jgi:hypothetical protein